MEASLTDSPQTSTVPDPRRVHASVQRPAVTFGMNCYKAERWIGTCLDSLLAQTFADFEIVISDNGSPDRTVEIARQYAARDPRIRVLTSDHNMGVSANVSKAFANGRGEFHCWASATDAYHPRFLEGCMELLRADPTVALVTTGRRVFADDPSQGERDDRAFPGASHDAAERITDIVTQFDDGFAFRGVWRRSMIEPFMPCSPRFGQDMVMVVQAATLGRVVHLPQPYYYERRAPGAITAKVPVHLRLPHYEPKAGLGCFVFHRIRNMWDMWKMALTASRGPVQTTRVAIRLVASLVPLRGMVFCDVNDAVSLASGWLKSRLSGGGKPGRSSAA